MREAIERENDDALPTEHYRECECFGCTAEAGWQDDETGAWFCDDHATGMVNR